MLLFGIMDRCQQIVLQVLTVLQMLWEAVRVHYQVDNSLYPKITAKAFQQCGLTKNAKPCSLCGNLCPFSSEE